MGGSKMTPVWIIVVVSVVLTVCDGQLISDKTKACLRECGSGCYYENTACILGCGFTCSLNLKKPDPNAASAVAKKEAPSPDVDEAINEAFMLRHKPDNKDAPAPDVDKAMKAIEPDLEKVLKAIEPDVKIALQASLEAHGKNGVEKAMEAETVATETETDKPPK